MRKKRRRANRKYKNRLFLKVFEKKEDILSLYNAVNDSNYENPDDLEITTLDNVLVSKIRENLAKGKTLEGAIEEAIRDCLNCGFLTELLTKYRQEVIGMLLTEYDEKRHLKNTYEQGRADGWADGNKEGLRQGIRKGIERERYRTAHNLYLRGFTPQDAAIILEEDEKTVTSWFRKWKLRSKE